MLPAIKNDAISVSSKMLICATDEPKIAGAMSFRIRRTPSCAKPEPRPRQQVEPLEKRKLKAELDDTGNEHARCKAERRPLEQRPDAPRERDHDDVQQHGRERRDGEPAMRVQHAACERRQRDEEDVRERQAQHVDRETEPLIPVCEAGREHEDQQRRRDDSDAP